MGKNQFGDSLPDQRPVLTQFAAGGLHLVTPAHVSLIEGFGSTHACSLCGRHRARPALTFKRLMGRNQLVCCGGCQKDKDRAP